MRAEQWWALIRFVITALMMFIMWLLFTASFDPFSLTMGVIGSLLIAAMTYDVFIARHQAHIKFFLPNPFFLIIYILVLIYSMYSASFRMLGAIITGNVHPRIVHFRTRLRSDFARMLLANSITLTPGTITLDLNDDHLTVHWLFCSTTHSKAAGEAIKGRLEAVARRVLL
ncbi:MAG: Na+/H+ antiporter subunit E [Spirochaetota bacterium]